MELQICSRKINNHGDRLSMEEPRLETESEQRSGEENKRTGQIVDRKELPRFIPNLFSLSSALTKSYDTSGSSAEKKGKIAQGISPTSMQKRKIM